MKRKKFKKQKQEQTPDPDPNQDSAESIESMESFETLPSTDTPINSIELERGFLYRIMDSFYHDLFGQTYDNQDAKYDRIVNFFTVPGHLEKLMFFGYIICLDSFLYLFTMLPLRILISFWALLKRFLFRVPLNPFQKTDLLKGGLLISCSVLIRQVDASRLYHSIRGQTVIKLHVIFASLEILEKLCAAFGHDTLDALFATVTNNQSRFRYFKRFFHYIIATMYVCIHTLILFYQAMSLNVAINSYNNVLLTLMLSNQFVEIKGSVFKKFESGNLFQLACADIAERFQLSVFLAIITIRNFFEILGDGAVGDVSNYVFALVDQLWVFVKSPHWKPFLSSNSYDFFIHLFQSNEWKLLQIIFGPTLIIFGLEIMVDWIKHAFIVKFNGMNPNIYTRYKESICRDALGIRLDNETPQQLVATARTPIVSRRIGLVSIPLACLVIRVASQIMTNINIMPGTLVDEQWEDEQKDEEEIGQWKLPLKLIKWIQQTRKKSDSKPNWFPQIETMYGYVCFFIGLLCLKLVLGEWIRTHARTFLHSRAKHATVDPESHQSQIKHLDTILGTLTPSHFMPEHLMKEGQQPVKHVEISDKKLDSIDRFTMVKSRIV